VAISEDEDVGGLTGFFEQKRQNATVLEISKIGSDFGFVMYLEMLLCRKCDLKRYLSVIILKKCF